MDDEKIGKLLNEAWDLPDEAPVKVNLLQEALRIAETGNDKELCCDIRDSIVQAGIFSAKFDAAFVAFSKNLQIFENEPEVIDHQSLFWQFKWIINCAHHFQHISRSQIEKLEDDMHRHYESEGHSLRPVNYLRCTNALRMGDFERAEKYFEVWNKQPRDQMADCQACEVDSEVDFHVALGNNEKAIEAAAEILNGKLTCSEVPQLTYGHVIVALMRLGNDEEAAKIFKKGYRKVAGKEIFLTVIAWYLIHKARQNDHTTTLQMIEKNLPVALTSTNRDFAFDFLSAAHVAMQAIEANHAQTIKLKVPEDFPLKGDAGEFKTIELSAWFKSSADQIGREFNERNGSTVFTDRAAEMKELAGV